MAKNTTKTRTKVSISGIPQLNKVADQLKKELFAMLGDAVMAGSDIIRDDAKGRARIKSGELADGIISAITWNKGAPVAFAGVAMDPKKNDIFVKHANGKRYYYPASIEYGHPGAPAYPFMRPAMDENKAKVRKEVRDRIKKVIEGVRP